MVVGEKAIDSVPMNRATEIAMSQRNELAGFGSYRFGPLKMVFPYWFAVLVSGLLASAFRKRWPWRISLREIFVLTTFVAVVLGMVAWLDRAWIGK